LTARSVGLIEAVLGSDAYLRLPPEVRRVHGCSSLELHGAAVVDRGSGLLNSFCAFAGSLPKAQPNAPVCVRITIQGAHEIWQRRFANSVMTSKLSQQGKLLREKLGLLCFDFELAPDASGFTWQIQRVSVLGVPLPAALFSGVFARSFAQGGVYQFEVSVNMPVVGLLVAYRGHLV